MNEIIIRLRDWWKINTASKKQLYKWWHELNTWSWPDALPPVEWRPWKEETGEGRRSALRVRIEQKVGRKYLLWQHNKERMTTFEFYDFWEGEFNGNAEAKERYNKASLERCLAEREAREHQKAGV